MNVFYNLYKNFAFKVDAEKAHELTIKILSDLPRLSLLFSDNLNDDESFNINTNSGKWSFPIGLAAGLDKNGECIDYFSKLLFGAVEVGTVTPRAQDGNPKPRLFRYKREESLRNCMGFNNQGADALLLNIKKANRNGKPLGVNLGKNKTTPQEKSCDDYLFLYKKFASAADYLVINLSSPNTPGLRDLLATSSLREIFQSLSHDRNLEPCPLYLKISPDMALEQISEICEISKEFSLSGIIATNTTIIPDLGSGGVSGKLLSEKSKLMREKVLEMTRETPEVETIGVGGISSFEDVWDFWKKGGKCMQIYTSFIYQGPSILKNIKNQTDFVMKKNQLSSLDELFLNISKVDL